VPEENPENLRIVRRFNASPEQVFDAWLAPETTSKWLFSSGGVRIANEIDARPGGSWLMTDRYQGTDYTACGEYLEIARPRRLVFTFAMPIFSPNSDQITVEFAHDGDGCLQTFTQHGVDISKELRAKKDEEESESKKVWDNMFDGLEAALR
jgi:uncharacterized protein YndB with AHSA1/START domain